MIVHILHSGLPLCGFTSDEPRHWPFEHKWVGPNEAHIASCHHCIAELHNQDEREVRVTTLERNGHH